MLLRQAEQRAEYAQNRLADAITAFAGSMLFVYIHVLWFGSWIAFGVENYPFGLLTMIVSLEAIFLSTFVLISRTVPTPSGRSSQTSNGRRSRRRTSRTSGCSNSPNRFSR